MNENLNIGPGGWAEIEILTPDGTQPVTAHIMGAFAVHGGGSIATLTHLRTGRSVVKLKGHTGRSHCYDLARRLRAEVDEDEVATDDVERVVKLISDVVREWEASVGDLWRVTGRTT